MPITKDGLLIYYHAKEGFGSNWKNLSPNTTGRYNGEIIGVVKKNDYISFDGVDDCIRVPSLNQADVRNEYEFEIYFSSPFDSIDVNEVGNILLGRGSIETIGEVLEYHLLMLGFDDLGLEILSFEEFSNPYVFKKNSVEKINYSYNIEKNSEKIYVNNVLIADKIITPTGSILMKFNNLNKGFGIGTATVSFGEGEELAPSYFNGNIHSFKLYGRELTQTERVNNSAVGYDNIGLDAPIEPTYPMVNSVKIDNYKVSNIIGSNISTLEFSFNEDVTEWKVVLLGVSHDTGTLLDSGGIVSKDNNIFSVIYSERLLQEGLNRINIYGKNTTGWTKYT